MNSTFIFLFCFFWCALKKNKLVFVLVPSFTILLFFCERGDVIFIGISIPCFFLLTSFYCIILLFSVAFIYSNLLIFASTSVHLCWLSILDTYLYLLKLSLVLLLFVMVLLIFPFSSKKYFNSSYDISGHSSLVTNRVVFFLHGFIRCYFDSHA